MPVGFGTFCRASASIAAGLLLASCVDADRPDQVIVSAAASVSGALEAIASDFEAAHPDVDVVINTGSSTTLANQILAGASADVFVSADEENARRLLDADRAPGPLDVIGSNEISAAVSREAGEEEGDRTDAPSAVPTDLDGLADYDGIVAMCSRAAPCGRLADELLDRAGVSVDESAISRNTNAAATLSAVLNGGIDVGLIYRSDVVSHPGELEELRSDVEAPRTDVVALGLTEAVASRSFLAFLSEDAAQARLAAAGIGAP